MQQSEFLKQSNDLFAEHYKYVGELKRKHEAKQYRRFQMIIVGILIIFLCGIWG